MSYRNIFNLTAHYELTILTVDKGFKAIVVKLVVKFYFDLLLKFYQKY